MLCYEATCEEYYFKLFFQRLAFDVSEWLFLNFRVNSFCCKLMRRDSRYAVFTLIFLLPKNVKTL